MEMTLRPANEQEQLYGSSQSSQISAQTGFLGWLRGDVGNGEDAFKIKWYSYGNSPQNEDCQEEIDAILGILRTEKRYDQLLNDRNALRAYCTNHPSDISNGFYKGACYRVDIQNHTYILQIRVMDPDRPIVGNCYRRDWLNAHIEAAKQGIRFIDKNYNDLFRLADGDRVRIVNGNGRNDYICRYIDPCHLEVGNNLFHICEFAERMERAGNKVIPLRRSLPQTCLSVLESNGELIKITLGESGYEKTYFPGSSNMRDVADNINRAMGITKAQEAAMVMGSMFGWQAPGADPKNYDEKGHPIRPQHRDRDDAR